MSEQEVIDGEAVEVGELVPVQHHGTGLEVAPEVTDDEQGKRRAAKNLERQRDQRRAFAQRYGYSTTANSHVGGKRETVLKRDEFSCVRCGMTDEEHKAQWGRPITIDHKDKNRKNNDLSNLQTLCLRCHGRKDLLPELRTPRLIQHKDTVISMRQEGATYQKIADAVGFSIAAVWKWARIWEGEDV